MKTSPIHFTSVIAALAVVAAACGTPAGGGFDSADEVPSPSHASSTQEDTIADSPASRPRAAVGTLPAGPSALGTYDAPEFPPPLVDPAQIISGGPPPDGIPPIDEPAFLPVIDHLDLIPAQEPVVALDIDGDARAYPARILIWHEIVNDTVGGVPVAITYCPLCNSAATYVREINGVTTTFGTSGRLFASALVMYDRATETLWTHFDGRAVVGLLAGEELESVPSPLMSWEDFRTTYPNGLVLDESRTGHRRDYGRNPYVGYDDEDAFPFLFAGSVDERAVAMQRVVGISVGETSRAYATEVVSGDGGAPRATNIEVAGEPLVIFWSPGQSSALDDDEISGGRDVGTVGVFESTVDGEVLTFEAVGDGFADLQTGSTWNLGGQAVAGPLAGTGLPRVVHLDTFWFAWATYAPNTELIREP